MHLFSWWYLEEAKQWCGYQIKVVFRFPLLQILSNANIHQCFAIKVMRNFIVYRVIRIYAVQWKALVILQSFVETLQQQLILATLHLHQIKVIICISAKTIETFDLYSFRHID